MMPAKTHAARIQGKTARITDASAITILCESCDSHCQDDYGSTMITPDSKTVVCVDCGTIYSIPVNAFRIVCTAKCREA
jgi:hypothetical protein